MTWLQLNIKPVGPLRFRGPGEFSPMSKGPMTHGLTTHYPLPSTIAGAICNRIYSSKQWSPTNCDPDAFECLSQCLSTIFGDNYALRPGYVSITGLHGGSKLYAATVFGREFYVEKNSIDKLITGLIEMIAREGGLERKFDPVKFLSSKGIEYVEPAKREFIGISLEYGKRIVREGYIYRASDLDLYSSFNRKQAGDAGKPLEAYINVNIYTEKTGREIASLDKIVQALGGERYPAKFTISNTGGMSLPDRDTDIAGILLEPALIKLEDINPSLTLEEAYKQLTASVRGFKIQAVISPFSKIDIIIPGYTLKENRLRKPYLALPRGTIILGHGSPMKLYRDGVGYASRIGWGTIHPVEMKDHNIFEKVVNTYEYFY